MFGLSLVSDDYVAMLRQRIADLEQAIDDYQDQIAVLRDRPAPLRELGTPTDLIPFQPRRRLRQVLAELAAKEKYVEPTTH